jgi:hypothetical protein
LEENEDSDDSGGSCLECAQKKLILANPKHGSATMATMDEMQREITG